MAVLPPDLARLGEELAVAARRTAARRNRRRRATTAIAIGTLAFAALTPAALGPAQRELTFAGFAPPGCDHPRGARFSMPACDAPRILDRPAAWPRYS
jgi:hypothetical protein